MTDSVIPEDARQFLLKSVDSIAQWEGLVLLRANPDADWDAAGMARNLYIGDDEAAGLLASLVERGILAAAVEGGVTRYRYQPESEALDALIGRVAELYRQYLIPVTHIIHSRPDAALRVQEFANAFRIRKD